MLPAFQTFLPEGFLRERVYERFGKTMRMDDMAMLMLTGANAIGRLRVSAAAPDLPGNERAAAAAATPVESLAEILSDQGSRDLFEYLCDRYLISRSADHRRLAIERFDVDPDTDRYLGFEDMVSLLGRVNERKYEGSYESIAKAVRVNASPLHVRGSLRALFQIVALSVVLRNGDAHLKNFGMLYSEPTTEDCRLSPVYDLVCTTVFLPPDRLALKLGGRRDWPDRATLAAFGREHCDVDDAEREIDRLVEVAVAHVPSEGPDAMWTAMHDHIARVASSLSR